MRLRSLFAVVLASSALGGCESCARGRGAPGEVSVEKAAPSASVDAAATTLADPCRGLALPDAQHFVPPGMCARVVATHQGRLRQITFTSNGDLWGVTVDGVIRRYRDVNGDGMYSGDEIVEWAKTGSSNGHNAEIDEKNGYLYAGTKDGVKRWRWSATTDRGGDGEDVVTGQPGGGNHPYHPLHVYEGFLYVDSGSLRNSMDPMPDGYDTERAVIKRFDLAKFTSGKPFEWKDGEIFVKGARNVTGFGRDAKGRIYGVVSGLDDLRYEGKDVHADNPGDEVVLLEKDKAFGYPFCFAAVRIVKDGKVLAPGTMLRSEVASQNPLAGKTTSTKDDAWCAKNAEPPLSVLQAHASSLSIAFFTGPAGNLPDRWKNGAFIALHGSWDRDPSTGYKVVWLPFDESGKPPMPSSTTTSTTFPYEVVFGGGTKDKAKDGAWGWSVGGDGEDVVRPVGVAVSPIDGALYVSSDNGGVALTKLGKKEDGNLYRVGVKR